MSCHKFEEYLQGMLDISSLKAHMQNCQDCREAFQTDKQILDRSKNLNQNLKVPDIWNSIQNEIKEGSADQRQFRFREKLFLAAAAMILITTAVWIINSNLPDSEQARILSGKALEKVEKAEREYVDAINDLENLAYDEIENTTEPLAQLYRNKLSLIDQQIRNCQEALENNPANSHIRQYLMAALQDKHKTLKDILQISS